MMFWLSVLLIAYSYVFYPLLLIVIAKFFALSPVSRCHRSQPDVAVVIAAFNEEQSIQARVENLLNLDYPSHKLHIYIGSDGSTDKTNAILNSFEQENVTVRCFDVNRGKASTLNDLMQEITQPIVVFSDANTEFKSDAVTILVEHFDDKNVGLVSGELHLFEASEHAHKGDNKDGVYWKFEQMLKRLESQVDAMVGANGAIYALRRELYIPLASNTIVDDFMIAMQVARSGKRLVYAEEACAYEEIAPNLKAEQQRRVRIGMGNYQAFLRSAWALSPTAKWRSVAYIGHKVLRWFTPHFMVIALVSSLILAAEPFFATMLFIQLLGYAIAIWGTQQSYKRKRVPSFAAFISFFVSMNWSLLLGFIRFCSKDIQGTWQRTAR
ncbi:glycosyltransferase family 2 protein [Alginatibacterium sediminis]|nr:glycosyltransferase family 2 protein [Alginatibacterium sediminis]